MREAIRRTGKRPGVLMGAGLIALLAGVAQAEDETASEKLIIELAPKPLDLLLTRDELRAIVHRYEVRTGEVLTTPIDDDDEVVVTGPRELAPMRDASQDVWGGIAAPFWALMNPKDGWRIFVPVPPKRTPKEAEPPAPDPR